MSRLKPCPDKPNCISSLSEKDQHKMSSLIYGRSETDVLAAIKRIVMAEKRTKLIAEEANYLHFTFESALFGFIDDVEFELDTKNKRIEFRSASRVGYSDLGANRKRMEDICIKIRPHI